MTEPSPNPVKTSAGVKIRDNPFKRRMLKALKIALSLFTTVFTAAFLAFGAMNHAVIHLTEIESKGLTRLMENFNAVDAIDNDNTDTKLAEQQLADFQQYFYFSPESDTAVGWIVLDALTTRIHGPEASENVVRQALNRLQGWELNLFLTTLDNRIKGYRHADHNDPLENEELTEKLREGLLGLTDIYEFSKEELDSLKACEQTLSVQIDQYEWMSGYQMMAEMIYPGSLYDGCSLTGKIRL